MGLSRLVAEDLGRASWIRRMSDEAARLRERDPGLPVYDFSLGNPDLEPPPALEAALADIVAERKSGSHGYMPNLGYPEVRAAVARRASGEQGLQIPSSNVAMSVGAAGGLNVVLKALVDLGDEVVGVRPYFAEYKFYVRNYGATFVPVDARPDFSLDPGAIAAALTPRTACLILNSPNNPTGRIYSRDELAEVAAILEEHGRRTCRKPYIVADEPYRELAYGGAAVPSVMEAYAETIVVSSWSKSLSLPGERIGYVAVSPRCAEQESLVAGLAFCTRTLGFVNAPALMQRAVARVLDARVDVAAYERRGRLLAEGLRAAGYEFPEPQGAFYIFARVPEGSGSDVDFAMSLADRRVIVVPGSGFGSPGYFRLAFCVPEDTIRGALPLFEEARQSRAIAGSPAGR